MRWDIPLRIFPLIAVPLAIVGFSSISTEQIGLADVQDDAWWIVMVALLVPVFLVSLLFSMRYMVGYSFSKAALPLEILFYLILNPVAEEMFFRGLAQSQLAYLLGTEISIIAVAFIFGFHHWLAGFSFKFLCLATVGGFVFGVISAGSGSILPAVLLHSAADLGLFIIGPWYAYRINQRTSYSKSFIGRMH